MYEKTKSWSITFTRYMKDTILQTGINVTHQFLLNYHQVYTPQLKTLLMI